MSDRYFVDTHILMYAHDTAAGAKHERARALVEDLWRNRSGVVSTQVLQELSVNVRRKTGRPLTTKATRELVSDYLSWQVVVNGTEAILKAGPLNPTACCPSSACPLRRSSPRSAPRSESSPR
jgi:predicted nucleic acid-binding protein